MTRPSNLRLAATRWIGTGVLLGLLGWAALRPAATAATAENPGTATAAPSESTAAQACTAPKFYQGLWDTHRQLGCPTSSASSNFNFQKFRRGITLWREAAVATTPSDVYGFYYDGMRWESQEEPGGPPRPSCEEGKLTDLGPIFSFGTLWCEPYNWKSRLGSPLTRDTPGGTNPVQDFDNGTILSVKTAGGYILYPNGKWEGFKP